MRDAAERVIKLHEPTWRGGARSAEIWRSSLSTYAYPKLGKLTVDTITTAHVLSALMPIWNEKRETARRVRQRIGAVMKWAIAEGHRDDNPAGEAIAQALPRNSASKAHHRALPHGEVGEAEPVNDIETVRRERRPYLVWCPLDTRRLVTVSSSSRRLSCRADANSPLWFLLTTNANSWSLSPSRPQCRTVWSSGLASSWPVRRA